MDKEVSTKSSNTSTKKADKNSANSKADKNSDKTSSSDAGGSEKSSSGATAKGGASARPISYFSSVATDEYREGWANIFGKSGSTKQQVRSSQDARPSKKQPPNRIIIHEDDVTEELNTLLREILKKKARKKKLNIGRQLNKAELSWSIECRIKY